MPQALHTASLPEESDIRDQPVLGSPGVSRTHSELLASRHLAKSSLSSSRPGTSSSRVVCTAASDISFHPTTPTPDSAASGPPPSSNIIGGGVAFDIGPDFQGITLSARGRTSSSELDFELAGEITKSAASGVGIFGRSTLNTSVALYSIAQCHPLAGAPALNTANATLGVGYKNIPGKSSYTCNIPLVPVILNNSKYWLGNVRESSRP